MSCWTNGLSVQCDIFCTIGVLNNVLSDDANDRGVGHQVYRTEVTEKDKTFPCLFIGNTVIFDPFMGTFGQ